MKGIFALGYATLVRLLVPGFVFTLALMPLGNAIAARLGKGSAFQLLGTRDFGDGFLLFLTISAFVGALLSLADYVVYKLFEDWLPLPFRARMRRSLECKVARWYAEVKQLETNRLTRSERYNALWRKLKDFPLDEEGAPTVPLATRIGNILRAYEEYPFSRYRMESVLYWYRLRMVLDEDKKREMDQASAEADSAIFTVFVLYVASLCYLLGSIISLVPLATFKSLLNWSGFVVASTGLAIAYGVYRSSLPLHRRNGEYFKAMFDTHGYVLQGEVEGAPPVELDLNLWTDLRRRWRYLQFLRVRCEHDDCDELFVPAQPPRSTSCPKCGRYPFRS